MVKFNDKDLIYFILDQVGIKHLMEVVKMYCDYQAKIDIHQYEGNRAQTMQDMSLLIETTFLKHK